MNRFWGPVMVNKVNMSLYTPWRHTREESLLQSFLTSALDGCERTTSRPDCFTPREKNPGIHSIRKQVGLRRDLNLSEKKVFLALSESVPQIFQVFEQLLYWLGYSDSSQGPVNFVKTKSNLNCIKRFRPHREGISCGQHAQLLIPLRGKLASSSAASGTELFAHLDTDKLLEFFNRMKS